MRRIRVLLVEDHDFTRSTLAATLRAEDFVVVASVSTARDALLAVNEHDVDCAVIDLNLGRGPSGIDVAYGLREHDPRIGILLLTAFADRRLHSGDERPLPLGAHYAVKHDIRSSAQLRDAVHIALGVATAPPSSSTARLPLSDTQMETVRMLDEGLTNAEIAKRRGVSERTVQTTIGRIVTSLKLNPAPGQNPRVLILRACRGLDAQAHID